MKRYFLAYDLSKAEPAMMAALSGDPNLISLFRAKKDVYKGIYSQMTKIAYDEVSDERREVGKELFLSVIYSLGNPYMIARKLKLKEKVEEIQDINSDGSSSGRWYTVTLSPMDQAKRMLAGFKDSFPRLFQFIDEELKRVFKSTVQKSYLGRRVQYKEVKSADKKVQRTVSKRIINNLCQNSVGSLLKEIMRDIDKYCQSVPDFKDILVEIPVFDAVYLSVPENLDPIKMVFNLNKIVEREFREVPFTGKWSWGWTWGNQQPIIL